MFITTDNGSGTRKIQPVVEGQNFNKLQAASCKLQAASCKLQAPSFKLQA